MASPEGRWEGARLPAAGRRDPIRVGPAAPDGGREERAEAGPGYAERRTRSHGPARAERGHRSAPRPARATAGGHRPALLRGPVRGGYRRRDADQPRRGEESHRARHGLPEGGPGAGRLVSEGLPDPGGVASQAELRAMVERYVDELKTAGAFESAAVERALRGVERHRLLETLYYRTAEGRRTIEHDPGHPRRDHLALIYADTVLATRHIGGLPASSTSQASLVARMLELLDVREGMNILEVGAGTGYNAALPAAIPGGPRLLGAGERPRERCVH